MSYKKIEITYRKVLKFYFQPIVEKISLILINLFQKEKYLIIHLNKMYFSFFCNLLTL